MKKIIYCLFAVSLLFMFACSDDDDPISDQATLNLDGDNFSAPRLEADTYEAAAQFTASEVAPFSGQRLTEVLIYMYNRPLSTKIKVYGAGTGNVPGNLLYEGDQTGSIDEFSWVTHTLSEPLELTGEELWISVELRHAGQLQSIGCDEGPSTSGGDWLFQQSDGTWQTFRDRGGASINWNIRGVIEE